MILRPWLAAVYRRLTTRTARLRSRDRRMNYSAIPAMVATLEPRQLLSATNPAAEGLEIQTINWNGQDCQAQAGSWIVGLDNKGGDISAMVQATLLAANADGPAVSLDHVLLGSQAIEITTDAGATYSQVLAKVKGLAGFEYLEPNFIFSTADVSANATPNDPSFSSLYGMHNTGQTGGTVDADIDAPEAWNISTGSSSVVVGVIDTGVDYTHPDLVNNMWVNPGETAGDSIDNDGNGFVDDIYGWDFVNNDSDPFDDNDHGTHCSGTIGGTGNNGVGVAGVNWDVSIMALKFLDAGGSGSLADAVEAINYATMMKGRGVNIRATSNSWGGGGFSQSLLDAIQASSDANMLFIAAAGNGASDNDVTPSYPASYEVDNVIAVAATDHNDALASFSQYGATSVDLAAPGVAILSTTPGNTYQSFNGTSMATPHVSGVAALAFSVAPNATAAQVKAAILAGVDQKANLNGVVLSGGRLNAANTLGILAADGPFVVSSDPDGTTVGPISFIEFDFSEAMNTGSFSTAADIVTFTGPGGANLLPQVTGSSWTGNTLRVTFTGQSAVGAYSMTIGPNILATDGDAMNQDHDDFLGEAVQDRYTASFNIPSVVQYTATDHAFEAINLEAGQSGVFTIHDNADDASVAVDLGANTFNFYGTTYTGSQMFVSSNGLITFGTAVSGYTNTDLTSSPAEAAIAPFWDDLRTNADALDAVFGKIDGNRLIIEWSQIQAYPSSPSTATFQTILELNTGTRAGNIVFNYVDTDTGNGAAHGATATVGIKPENGDVSPEVLVSFNATNPLIGNSQAIKLAVPGNTAPVIGAFDAAVNYTENAVALLDDNATVSDTDSANFDTGQLTVSLITNAHADDRLSIRNQGTGAGQIGRSGTTVTFGGTAIASFGGGVGTSPLVVTFNTSATPTAVQALLRNLTYSNVSNTPSTLARTVRVSLTDGDGGTSNQPTKTINVTAVNDAPTVTNVETTALAYAVGAAATSITSTLTVGDLDNANLTIAQVRMTTNYQNGQDVLSFTNANGITGSWNASTGIMTLSGTTTLANYQTALRNVKYRNTSGTPITLTRTVQFVVSDGTTSSAAASRNITVGAVNNAPVLAGIEATPLAYTENAAATSITSTVTVTDANSANMASARIKIATNYQNGQDVLSFTNANGITGAWDAATGTLVLTGNTTKANYQAALRAVKYTNTSNTPSTLTRTVQILVNDGTINSNVISRNITVTATNDAPVLSGIEATALNYLENQVTSITSSIVVSDADHANLTSARIKISANYQNGQDVLSFTNANGITGAWDAATGTLVLTGNTTKANYQAALRAVKYTNTSNTPNTLTRTVIMLVNDGVTNSNLATRNITVAAVNDAPVIGSFDTAVNYTENGIALLDTNATVADVDSINFATGTLTIALVTNGHANDRLTILNQGTGAGEIGVNGTNVTFGGTTIGTFTGGSGTTALTVTFNASANAAAAQALLRTIAYFNVSETPTTAARKVRARLTDGDGGTSNQPEKTINVTAMPNAPLPTSVIPASTIAETSNTALPINANGSGSLDFYVPSLALIDDLQKRGKRRRSF